MIRRYGIAAIVMASALAASVTPASAATGTLFLQSGSGAVALQDPPPGCYNLAQGFTAVTNRTNTSVVVYSQARCEGFSLVVDPGGPTSVGLRHSVRVPR